MSPDTGDPEGAARGSEPAPTESPAASPEDAKVLPYSDSFEQIEDAKVLVRLWLQRHLVLYSERYRHPDPTQAELYVGADEVEAFLRGQIGPAVALADALQDLDATEARFRAHAAERAMRSADEGLHLPLEDLRAAFDVLDERVHDLLVALLVVELDPDFLRAYSHAWCDFTKRQASVGFLVELIARTAEDRNRLIAFFGTADHPLFLYDVLRLESGGDHVGKPLVERTVRPADRLVDFVCGRREPPADLVGPGGGLHPGGLQIDEVLLPAGIKSHFLRVFHERLRARGEAGVLLLHGPDGVGKRALCAAAAATVGRRLLIADLGDLPAEPERFGRRLRAFLREARLQNALPLLAGADALWSGPGPDDAQSPRRIAELATNRKRHAGLLLLTGPQPIPALDAALPGTLQIPIPHPSREVQKALWTRHLGAHVRFAKGLDVDEITARYSLAGGTIAAVSAEVLHLGAAGKAVGVRPEDIFPAIRRRLRHRLGSVAVPVERGFAWDDLVVPKKTQEALREFVAFVRNREQIMESWGFGRKVSYGRGTSALFHGPPGTGKTMAASIIGTELGVEVFQVDLSRIIDKYVGETEKNLSRVFDEGSRAQALLLFDEADSLFGKRTSVKTSVDRYANLEVNFLLQMMEAYEGVCVLTTNFQEAIDDAFKRRIRFKVPFPFPVAEEREVLWKSMLPSEAPVSPDLSFRALAEQFELSGANIKNVVLRAAAMAAERNGVLSQEILVQAANREYAELGKIVREARPTP